MPTLLPRRSTRATLAAYLAVGVCALVLTYVSTFGVRWLAVRLGFIVQPSDRKVHAHPTPTLGGAAIFIGMVGAGILAVLLPQQEFRQVFTSSSEPLGIAAGGLIIFTLGVVDDVRDLPAPVKLAGQVFASGIVYLAGVQMRFIPLPDQVISLGADVSVLVTVLWLVVIINAVNLVDGLDGLAAGIVAIAASAFFVYTYQLEATEDLYLAPTAPLVAIIIVGSALGFLRHNFHPATIFMGDSGAMLFGLVLGAATVSGVGNVASDLARSTSGVFLLYFPLLIPLAVLALPIADALLAIVRRARQRRSIFHADKQHIHHRLMDMGHGHRQAVIVMYVWSALAAGAGLAFSFLDREDVIFALPIAVGAIVLYTLFPLLTKLIQERLST
jgi:UDP-GlcNAc:undecaprenyl-phosphate/decaprenyl-phosphate GlcNAc-1-phosphate transferase